MEQQENFLNQLLNKLDVLHFALVGAETVSGSNVYSEKISEYLYDIQEDIRQELKRKD